jgi:hypothetical protein
MRLKTRRSLLPQPVRSSPPKGLKQTCSRDCLVWKRRSLRESQQFAQLTLALLQERERSVEHRLTTDVSLSCNHWWEDSSPRCRLLGLSKNLLVHGVRRDLCIPLNNSLDLVCLP